MKRYYKWGIIGLSLASAAAVVLGLMLAAGGGSSKTPSENTAEVAIPNCILDLDTLEWIIDPPCAEVMGDGARMWYVDGTHEDLPLCELVMAGFSEGDRCVTYEMTKDAFWYTVHDRG